MGNYGKTEREINAPLASEGRTYANSPRGVCVSCPSVNPGSILKDGPAPKTKTTPDSKTKTTTAR